MLSVFTGALLYGALSDAQQQPVETEATAIMSA